MRAVLSSRWAYILISILLVSVTSLVGMLAVAIDRKRLSRFLPYLVSLAAGALLGAAGAHLLPEAIQQLGTDWHLSALLVGGFVVFFLVEKSLSILSCHFGRRAFGSSRAERNSDSKRSNSWPVSTGSSESNHSSHFWMASGVSSHDEPSKQDSTRSGCAPYSQTTCVPSGQSTD